MIRLKGQTINQDGLIDIKIDARDLLKQLSQQGFMIFGYTVNELREALDGVEFKETDKTKILMVKSIGEKALKRLRKIKEIADGLDKRIENET